MDNLTSPIKNSSIIELNFDDIYYAKFKQKLFDALKKFNSGRKTRAVHGLVDKNIIRLGSFSGDASTFMSVSASSSNKLKAIYLNLYLFDDSIQTDGAVKIAGEITTLQNKIQKEKTYLTDKQILSIEEMNLQLNEKFDKFMKSLDFIKMIDGIYFEYLRFLTDIAISNDHSVKPKLVSKTSDIISMVLRKMYISVNRISDPETNRLIDAVGVYFILIFYYGESGRYAIQKLKTMFSDEIIELLQKTKITRFTKFTELANIIRELNVLNITEDAFEAQLRKIYGRYGYDNYVESSLQNFIAINANLAHSTQLFNAFPLNDEVHLRLEELVLNEQKKIVVQHSDF